MSKISAWLAVALFIGGCSVTVGVVIGQLWLTQHAWIQWPLWTAFVFALFMALRETLWCRRYFWQVVPYLVPLLSPKTNSAPPIIHSLSESEIQERISIFPNQTTATAWLNQPASLRIGGCVVIHNCSQEPMKVLSLQNLE